MNTNRYYFPSFIEDDTLSILAVQAKEVLQKNDNIVNIFQVNDELLYGHSPRQVLFLMKQNNKSIFSWSPTNENISIESKSNQGLSTPVTRNPDISNIPRRYLPLDDAEKKIYNSSKLEPNTSVIHRTKIFSSKDEALLNPTIDETAISDERFVSSIDSKGSPKAGNQESPRSAVIAKMTANLTMTEKELADPEKMVGNMDANSQHSSLSSEVSIMTTSLTTAEKELENPSKVVCKINEGNQESNRSTEVTIITSSFTVDDKESRSLNQNDQMAGNYATNADNPEENPGKSHNPDSANKDFTSHVEGKVNFLEPIINISETPSPVKRSKICSLSAFGTRELASSEKVTMADISPDYTEAIVNPTSGYETTASPNQASEGIARGERKRKSLSPREKNTAPFRSIPRVIKFAGETEIDIEVCCDLEENSLPTTSRSLSADSRIGSIKDSSKNPTMCKSKTNISPMTFERYLHPSERAISVGSSRDVSGGNNSSSDKDDFAEKSPSENRSVVPTPTRDRSCKSESSSSDIESDIALLKHKILKFNMLLVLRGQFLDKMFCSFLSFQNGMDFLSSYVRNVSHTLLKISDSDEEYSTMELKETVDDACAVALKLTEKLTPWKTNVDLDVTSWNKLFKQIQQLKSQYEPLLNNEGKPAVTLEVAQVYEYEVKTIWKKMDEMLIMGDSLRALFSNLAHDLENLMKMFVKCLILVGILQLR